MLAWEFERRGYTSVLIDAEEPATASRVAAGLITPITGRRFVKTADYEDHLATARRSYRFAEEQTGITAIESVRIARLFDTDEERQFYEHRRLERYREDATAIRDEAGQLTGIEMGGYRLHTETYLSATKAWFHDRGRYHHRRICQERDVRVAETSVRIEQLGMTADVVVWCVGPWQRGQSPFPDVPNSPCRGDVLRLKIEGYTEQRVMNRGYWLCPDGAGYWLAGSTYDWDHLEPVPAEAGRKKILRGVSTLTSHPMQVVEHRAAIRPAMKNARPVTAQLPGEPRTALLNGLGARGALWAPHQADKLIEVLRSTGALTRR